ncbi:MAG: M1 family metallopeptidase [Acidimicrobiales bacterium]|nr:M1 family metallopeptidase [Acidimicrobiales bacterium]
MTPAAPTPPGELDHRLPRTVRPSRYRLELEPDLATATFRGREAVAIEVAEPVDAVVLNAVELTIDEAWLEGPTGDRLDATVELDDDAGRATLRLGATARPGDWTLHVGFAGILNDKLHGFYRSTFTGADGAEHVLATTQFEATDARRAFPCWDEPDLKAVFEVTLVVREGLTALSNARVVADEPTGDGRRRVRFADTMPMSTYLVAFVVGPLELTAAVDVDGVPLRVAHVPGKEHLTAFALDTAAFCLRFFADYYGIPYPGDKVDLVAIPDFAFGAMENLGCITFREALLLVDPAQATQAELQLVADVVAHELAHMWFGDLVTMRWWNGIWLNEAFATFMETLAVDAFRPQWRRWVTFGLERSTALDVDALESTRPVEYPVHSPADADGMFDVLTYQKGAAVLRMLEQYLGADRFRDGIRHYLRTHQHGNTDTTDLWVAIEAATGEPVRRIMDSWIFQGGYPLVSASVAAGPELRLHQQRFRYDGVDDPTSWSVPLLVRVTEPAGDTSAARIERTLLESGPASIPLPDSDRAVVVVNAGGHGFLRVRYAPELLDRLTRSLSILSPIERYGLVDDTWASVLSGAAPASSFVELVSRFGEETELAVWQSIHSGLGLLDRLLEGGARGALQQRVRALAGPALERLSWEPAEGEDELTRELRGVLIRMLGVLGNDDAVQEEANAVQRASEREGSFVDANVAAAAVVVTAFTGAAEEYERFVERARSAATPQEELRYLYALAEFDRPELMQRTLEASLDWVRTQSAPLLLARCLRNRDHGASAWTFVRQHWAEISDRFPPGMIVRVAEGVRALTRPEVAADVEAFFAEHPLPRSAKTLAQHLERLRVNVALRQRDAAPLAADLT